jgi:ankyrin repeat protein
MNFKNIFSRKSKWDEASEDEQFMALKEAINSCSIDELRNRIKEGIDINTCDSYSNTNILMFYSSNAKKLNWNPTELIEFIKYEGVDINHLRNNRLKGGFSALHFAVIQKNLDLTQVLVNSGAEIEIRDGNGNTPLWKAVMDYRGETEILQIIKLLLASNASLDTKNDHGNSSRDNILRRAEGIASGHSKKEWDLTEILK